MSDRTGLPLFDYHGPGEVVAFPAKTMTGYARRIAAGYHRRFQQDEILAMIWREDAAEKLHFHFRKAGLDRQEAEQQIQNFEFLVRQEVARLRLAERAEGKQG